MPLRYVTKSAPALLTVVCSFSLSPADRSQPVKSDDVIHSPALISLDLRAAASMHCCRLSSPRSASDFTLTTIVLFAFALVITRRGVRTSV
ncbi:hypothetical protein WB66_11135 [bacteria symbiont BFo1 of Frankliniella occidentalis]|nr:hypothetical protein WB66_11135 [bacteria symbiont BFo1 of Frankliniella occidentalis]